MALIYRCNITPNLPLIFAFSARDLSHLILISKQLAAKQHSIAEVGVPYSASLVVGRPDADNLVYCLHKALQAQLLQRSSATHGNRKISTRLKVATSPGQSSHLPCDEPRGPERWRCYRFPFSSVGKEQHFEPSWVLNAHGSFPRIFIALSLASPPHLASASVT